ncbi:hypothetical protein DL769_002088 [Monosporascus sp. CRB-8-3]|nr:hypothetical protein DL769_002088 [Monosporascus sp. CRB-8-3]
MAKVHPSWTRSGSHFEQPYGFQEELYTKIAVPPGERGLFLIGTYVSFKYTGTQEGLAPLFRQTWIQMRHQFPGLAALTGPRGKTSESPTETQLEEWAAEPFKVRSITTWTAGVSCTPWDRFFRAIIEPKGVVFGDKVQRLPPRSDDLLDLSEKSPGRGKEVALAMLERLSSGRADLDAGRRQRLARPELRRGAEAHLPRHVRHLAGVQAQKFHRDGGMARGDGTGHPRHTGAGGSCRHQVMGFSDSNLRGYFPKKPTAGGDDPDCDAYAVSNHHTVLPVVAEQGEGRTFDGIAGEPTAFYRRGVSEPPGVWGAPRADDRRDRAAVRERRHDGHDARSVEPRHRESLHTPANSGFYAPRDVQAFHERVAQTMTEGLGLHERACL